MAASNDQDGTSVLTPDAAFSILGNETRMDIIQALGNTDDPLAFSALFEQVEISDSGQFNYHLNELLGHFVRKTDDGYELRQAGRRVIEAVLSGAVTHAPEGELSTIDEPCHYCGAPVAVRYSEERLRAYCTECAGTYQDAAGPKGADSPSDYGYLGSLLLPPAGLQGRSPAEVYRAAWLWANLEVLALASGICPRCSGSIGYETDICEDHTTDEGLCPECDRRLAVYFTAECGNCHFRQAGGASIALGAEFELLSFLIEHGINPIAPDADSRHVLNRVRENYDVELLEADPFEATFVFSIDDDHIEVTLSDGLNSTA